MKAFVVDAPKKLVEVVTGVDGRLATPYVFVVVSSGVMTASARPGVFQCLSFASTRLSKSELSMVGTFLSISWHEVQVAGHTKINSHTVE